MKNTLASKRATLKMHIWRLRRRWFYRPRRPQSLEERNIRLLFTDTAWQGLITAGTLTFLPVYLARLNASSFYISALTALPALVGVLLSLPASAYLEGQSDHVRATTRFRFFYRLTFLALVFAVLLPVEHQPWVIVVLWTLQAIPMAFVTLAWTSAVGVIVPARRRPAVNGGRWALLSGIAAVSVAIFGKVLDLQWLPFPWNYQLIFAISAFAGFMSIYFFSRIRLPESYSPAVLPRMPLRERYIALLEPMIHAHAFIQFIIATFFIRLGMALPVALYSIYWVQHLQATDTIIGLRTTVAQAALVAGYFISGRLASRAGYRRILILSAFGIGLYPLATALVNTPPLLLLVAPLWGFFTGGIDISFFEGLLETAPSERRASFAALNAVFANLAVFVGPLLGSALAEWLGIRGAFFIAGALSFLGAGLCWRLKVGASST